MQLDTVVRARVGDEGLKTEPSNRRVHHGCPNQGCHNPFFRVWLCLPLSGTPGMRNHHVCHSAWVTPVIIRVVCGLVCVNILQIFQLQFCATAVNYFVQLLLISYMYLVNHARIPQEIKKEIAICQYSRSVLFMFTKQQGEQQTIVQLRSIAFLPQR